MDFQTLPSCFSNFLQHQKASEDVLRTSLDIFRDVSWQFGLKRMCWYEDKGARPEGSGCSVWTSAGAHGSRTQAKLGINMDVHQAPCPLPPCLSLCAATVRCVPVNSINSMAATSSDAMPRSLINILRWLIMIPYSQTQQSGECRDELSLLTALFASQFADTHQLLWQQWANYFVLPLQFAGLNIIEFSNTNLKTKINAKKKICLLVKWMFLFSI